MTFQEDKQYKCTKIYQFSEKEKIGPVPLPQHSKFLKKWNTLSLISVFYMFLFPKNIQTKNTGNLLSKKMPTYLEFNRFLILKVNCFIQLP